jgi:nitrogen regulatory protein P-II 1
MGRFESRLAGNLEETLDPARSVAEGKPKGWNTISCHKIKEEVPVMKLITAVVRTTRLDDVVHALQRKGIRGMTISEIKGLGDEIPISSPYTIHDRIEIIVPDDLADRAVAVLLENGRVGMQGDGILAVQTLDYAVRIRTGSKMVWGRWSEMKVALFDVDKRLCADCSMALRRFIGGMDGVESIDVEQGKVAVKFDEETIDEEKLSKIAQDSIERLGYTIRR